MPAESARVRRPLGRRDRCFLALAACAALAATSAAAVVGGRGSEPAPGCVATIQPGFMGGQTSTVCGTKAIELCRARAEDDASLAADCRALGPAASPVPHARSPDRAPTPPTRGTASPTG